MPAHTPAPLRLGVGMLARFAMIYWPRFGGSRRGGRWFVCALFHALVSGPQKRNLFYFFCVAFIYASKLFLLGDYLFLSGLDRLFRARLQLSGAYGGPTVAAAAAEEI